MAIFAQEPEPRSPLRQLLDDAIAEGGGSLKGLTVLAVQNDPFRVDTPSRHRDGEWLAVAARELGLGDRRIHLRGLHYMVIGRIKPNGLPYTNTEDDWLWLSSDAGKAARWLRYIPFDQIIDQRNAPPALRIFSPPDPTPYLNVGLDVEIPDADEIEPQIVVDDFRGIQPYKLVIFGEKSSLADVLQPIAERYHADLYLPTGEISDTLLYQMARIGAEDGRPMVVLTFSDCDPAGWQMPISIARKLQAFRGGWFANLEFEVHRVGLIPDQVREYGLPSTPLKETERRADNWRHEHGVDQTEIDALASLRPDLLRQIARDALDLWFDSSLERRVAAARRAWLEDAQARVLDQFDPEQLATLRSEAAEKLAAMREQIDALNEQLKINIDTERIRLPVITVPEAELARDVHPLPLVDSRWSFAHQCRRLIDSKAYRA